MQFLLVNPNTSQHVTQRMVATAQNSLGTMATVHGVTASQGPQIVACCAENVLAAQQALELAVQHHAGMDAVILVISTDSGIAALRESLGIPVIGMLQAALVTAAQLGQRVGLLTLGGHMLPVYQEQLRQYQLDGLMHAWRAPQAPLLFSSQAQAVEPAAVALLTEQAQEMIAQNDLDVLVLSGAVLSGYRAALQAQLPVPVVDGIEAAAWQAVALAGLRPGKQRVGSFARVTGRVATGVSPALMAHLAGSA